MARHYSYIDDSVAIGASTLAFLETQNGYTNYGTANSSSIVVENLSVTGVSTLSDDVQFFGAAGITSVRWDKSQNSLEFVDGAYATWGTGRDLQIYHDKSLADQTDSNGDSIVDGRTSIIKENGSGGLVFKSDGGDGPGAYQFFDQGWRPLLKMHGGTNARTLLYHGGLERLETTVAGIDIGGELESDRVKITGVCTATTFKCTSTTDAFYPPIVTTTQMNAMTVNEGAVVYNTTTNRLTVYIGSQWKDVGSDP